MPEEGKTLSAQEHYEQQVQAAQVEESLGTAGLDDPGLGQALLEGDGPYKGIDPNNLTSPEDLQKIRKNMQRHLTQKTQDLARKERELEAQLQSLSETKIHEAAANKDVGEYDPFDPASIDALLEKKVAERLIKEREALKDSIRLERAKMDFEVFVAEHPDIKAMAPEIKAMCDARPAITPKEAYFMLKGQQSVAQRRFSTDDGGDNLVGTGRRDTPGLLHNGKTKGPPKGMSAYEAYEWFQKHTR